MYAVMEESQMNILAKVFGKDNLKVTTYSVDLPQHFALNWESVASPSSVSVWELSNHFRNNIEKYKHNRFINISKISNSTAEN